MGRVEISGLTKTFDDGGSPIVAVDDVDLTIEDGEFLVLVGPSGCGKSTTLRCIAGLERATEGKIVVDTEDITDRKPKNRDIAMVFQNYALYPHMTARENMGFGLKISTDLSRDEIDDRVDDAAAMMDIEDVLEKRPGELSGGQQQRVALGRAIVRDPDVFLLDEPLSNLDAKLRTSMRTELQSLQQELDVTTVYVTHDQTEAMTMGDRIAILDDGELCQIGTPLECYHQPADTFVASFIGSPSMNAVTVSLTTNDTGDTVLEGDTFEYVLSSGTVDRMEERPDDVTLGIRPEDLRLSTERTDDRHTFTAEVTVTEPLGERTFVYLEVAGQSCTASLPGTVTPAPGDHIDVVIPERKIHLFDANSGDAILDRSELIDADDAAASMARAHE